MENINLCEILKGHEGETFYSPIFGDLTFVCTIYPDVRFKTSSGDIWDIHSNGKLYNNSDELCVFPSKEQRDWNKWNEEQKHKFPKTWSELENQKMPFTSDLYIIDNLEENSNSLIEKSALALLKINQLIEVGYGGNPTFKEKSNMMNKLFEIIIDINGNFAVEERALPTSHVVFYSREQAEEFLKYPENVQLLKDLFITNE